MAVFLDNSNRKIVPRWRDSAVTIQLGELNAPVTISGGTLSDSNYLTKLADWQTHKSLRYAADLVSAAVVIGRHEEAKEAAEYLEGSGEASTAILQLAQIVIDETKPPDPFEAYSGIQKNDWMEIAATKLRVRADPENALAWIDLGRHYTNFGIVSKASKCIRVALTLQPENRFVLRSAARFYIHVNEAEHAFNLLYKSPATQVDPWLLSAEIATACVLDVSPRFVRVARKMIESGNHPLLHLSELLTALGTLDLMSGARRKARQLFERALLQPTENAVAQATWTIDKGIELNSDLLESKSELSHEAKSIKLFLASKWQESSKEGQKWLEDQPFSIRPAVHSSYVLSTLLEDYSRSIAILQKSLSANPRDPVLLNNLAFSYVHLGELEKAKGAFAKISRSSLNDRTEIPWTATMGLLHFRTNEPELGRQSYLRAISLAKEKSLPKLVALAAINLAREEFRLRTSEASKFLELAREHSKRVSDPDIAVLIKRLEKINTPPENQP